MARDASTKPGVHPPSLRNRCRQVLLDLACLGTAWVRPVQRSTIALPSGFVWRVSATLFVLIQYAERTGADADLIRQARTLQQHVLQLHGHRCTVRSGPITPTSLPLAEERIR